jgi:putative flippase GtrA
MKMLKEIATESAWLMQSLRQGRSGDAIARVLDPAAPAVWKLAKYLLIGVLSVVVFYAFYLLFRVCVEMGMGMNFQENRFLWNTLAIFFAFVPTNFFTYLTNRKWVFVTGKHETSREFFLFTVAAAASFLVGEIGVWWIVRSYSVNDFYLTLSFIAVTTLFNYAFRKNIVFHE